MYEGLGMGEKFQMSLRHREGYVQKAVSCSNMALWFPSTHICV